MGRSILVFDAVLVAAFAVSLYPAFTGYAVHEWLGVAVVAAMLAHVVIRLYDFLKSGAAGLKARRPGIIATSLLDVLICLRWGCLPMAISSGIRFIRFLLSCFWRWLLCMWFSVGREFPSL